jgi:hypothetical protein
LLLAVIVLLRAAEPWMSRSTSRATIRFKVVEMLQQNWALIEPSASRVTVYFIHGAGGVFDEILCASADAAASAMRLNGFSRFADDRTAVPAPPSPPFRRQPHPNGPIYSSGRFRRTA